MSSPLISIVIPYYNARQWLPATLHSVVEQRLEYREIILVDDGSSDDGAIQAAKAYPEIHMIRTENQGPSRARNLGTALARGRYLQYLDADDLLEPGKLATQLTALEQTGADVAYGAWQRLRAQSDGSFAAESCVDRRLSESPELELFTDFWCPPAAYLFRRDLVDRVGGWNERLPIIQDARFALDCALHGGRFLHCPGLMASYRVHVAESVSSRDSIGFVRDCFRNACEVEQWWMTDGGMSDARRAALVKVYGYVARASYVSDRITFDAAYAALQRVQPGYVPQHPWHLSLASRLLGYRRAEFLALWYRRGRQWLARRGIPTPSEERGEAYDH
jgi:glycosyltransferase involved in cell wall biosynthesis